MAPSPALNQNSPIMGILKCRHDLGRELRINPKAVAK